MVDNGGDGAGGRYGRNRGLRRRKYRVARPKSNLAEVDFLIERNGTVSPVEVKAGNEASASFDRILARGDVETGFKFVNGNVGRFGKKITLPHYMSMFV